MPDDREALPESEYRRRDFIAEAEDILEALSDDLRNLEAGFETGRPHFELINTVFRRAHSLKGFAGLLGFPDIASLTHALEDLLSRLRLGGALDGPILDLLHDTLDALRGSVGDLRSGCMATRDLAPLRDRLGRAAAAMVLPESATLDGVDLPESLRASLTEHEEGRLRACLAQGLHLSLVRLRPDPQSLEEHLQEVARRIALVGELISTLPAEGVRASGIVFDLLVASARPLAEPDLPANIVESWHAIAAPPSPRRGSHREPQRAALPAPDAGPPARVTPEELEESAGKTSSLRVPVARLDEVLAQVGELSIAVASMEGGVAMVRERHPGDRLVRELGLRMQMILSRLRAVQRGAAEARLVPLDQVFRKIGRVVARAARLSGKEIDLHAMGADTEIDKSVMDALASPLLHLVANAIDHGIEAPEERALAQKPRRGRLVLSAFRRGPSVVIDIIDDGRGIRLAHVKAAATARGLWPPDREMTPEVAHEFIFRPGFSTAAQVSEVSGRGVGMDVVRRTIRRLKGSIAVRSVERQGTTFSVTVPISLALVPAIIVQSRGERYAIPVASIHENLRLDVARVRDSTKGAIYDRPQGPLPLVRLDRLLAHAGGAAADPGTIGRYAVVTGGEGRRVGIVFDRFVGRQEVVVKPIGRHLRDLPGLAGAADLGDARAVLVLDPETLISGDRDVRAIS